MGDKLTDLLLAVCASENEEISALMTAVMLQLRGQHTYTALSLLQNMKEVRVPKVDPENWISAYFDGDFYAHFRLTRQSFDDLLTALSIEYNLKEKRNFGGNIPISLTKKLCITLWYLAKEDSLATISEHFDVAKSAVKEVVEEITTAIASLENEYILWPTAEECAIVEEKFRRNGGLAGVIGSVDSCIVHLTRPKDPCRSGKHVILQAVCTSELLFTDVFVALPDQVSDARVLASSGLYRKLSTEGAAMLFGDTYYLVAGAAYPTRQWLVGPYEDRKNLSARVKQFNARHAITRAPAERCLGLLKGRWRRLQHVSRTDMDKVSRIIMACCMLHNLCRRNYDNLEVSEPVQLLRTHQVLDDDEEAVELGWLQRSRIASSV